MKSRFRKFIGFAGTVLIFCQSAGQMALADDAGSPDSSNSATTHHCHHESACTQTATPASINLDLSSTAASVVFSGGHNAATVNIDVAGASQAVNAGQMLTPAQAVAAYQVLHSGVQNILLGIDGQAIGGSMVIGSHLANMLNSLVIPTGVTVVDRTSTLNLAGDLANSGTLLAISTNPAISSATISAANILNGQTGLLTTILPDGGLASLGLSSYSNLASNLSLSLNAINNIVNSGIISSAGNLNMTAGGSIENVTASPSAITPIMQAAGTLSMLAPQITNAGTIQSLYGNINVLSSIASPNISILGSNGTMEALNGAINLRDALYTGTGNINLFGGDWLSQQLNFYSGTGAIVSQIGEVTGTVTSYAGSAHLSANTANLILGDSCITGDPTYANTGDITISGTLTPSEALAIIAGGNIIGNSTAQITSNFAVTLVAGAHITSGGGTGGETVNSSSTGVVAPVSYVFDNTVGGNIDFTQSSSNPVITATGSAVTLLANSNSSTTGNIWFSTTSTSVQTNSGTANGGNILIVAGGSGGTAQSGATISSAIQTGAISANSTASGANGGKSGGAITIFTAAPVITGGTATYNTNGAITAGSYPTTSSSYTFTNSSITTGAISSTGSIGTTSISAGTVGGTGGTGGTVNISGGAITTANISINGGNGGNGGTGANGGNGGTGGSLSLLSTGNVLTGAITSNGGTGGGGGGGTSGQGPKGGDGGNGGTANIVSGSSSSISSNSISASGGGGGMSRAGTGTGAGGAGGSGGNGGTVTLSSGTSLSTTVAGITASGGNASSASNGATTGNGGAGGTGGNGGTVQITTGTLLSIASSIATDGGTSTSGGTAGGTGSGRGGAGGSGGTGGNIQVTAGTSITAASINTSGSNGSNAGTSASSTASLGAVGGNGGSGGTIQLTATSSTISIGTTVTANGGSGGLGRSGSAGGSGGNGNTITINAGGTYTSGNVSSLGSTGSAGGASTTGVGGAAGDGGSGNNITITAGSIAVSGGTGILSTGGNGATGGNSTSASGGAGGAAGNGGQISLTSTSGDISITAGNLNSNGGTGGNAGNGNPAGVGGAGGNANTISLNSAASINITVNIASTGGSGGTGGNGLSTLAGGTGGAAGTGSNIELSAANGIAAGVIATLGGTGGTGGTGTADAGDGADGGNSGNIALNANGLIAVTALSSFGGAGGNGGIGSGRGGAGGNGATAGTITIENANSATNIDNSINANGGTGGNGGSGSVTGNPGNGGNANNISIVTNELQVINNIYATGGAYGTGAGSTFLYGNGSTIQLTVNSTNTFTVGSTASSNYVGGEIAADGQAGGRINIYAAGDIAIDFIGLISAMPSNLGSGTSTGGNILLANINLGDINITNDGIIRVTQGGVTSGIIGIAANNSNNITISGSGSMAAGEFVNVGVLNTTTLAIQDPFVVVDPFSGIYTNETGNITIAQGSISGTLQVSTGASPPAPTPSSPSGSSSTITDNSSYRLFFNYLQYLVLLQDAIFKQDSLLNEQLGTRIATDYTPYTTYPMQPRFDLRLPLQGEVSVEKLADANGALFAASNFNAQELNALAAQGIIFGPKTGGNFFDLNKGDVVFMPTSDIQVQTKEGIVTIPKGAIVFVMETGNDAAVYDMHDSVSSPVKLVVNNKELTLSPGKQVLLTRDGKASFEALNPGNNIGTRNVREKDMGQGIKAYIADFTISGGISNVQVMRNMLKSNNPEHAKAANKMLKNAAILSDLGGYKTPYKTKP